MKSIDERFWSKVEIIPEHPCWEWIGYKNNKGKGYGKCWFENRKEYAHRASWIIHFGLIPKGLYVCHKCDNKGCVNPNHLFIGTHQDNVTDMVKKDRSARGERNGLCKLTRSAVLKIRADNRKHKEIAKEYGIHRNHVGGIKRREKWGYF